MKHLIDKTVLITTSDWFYGSDGISYKAVFGTVKSIKEDKEAFGFSVNRSHANWFVEIGNMTIAGCRVMYCVECKNPNLNNSMSWSEKEGEVKEFKRPSGIYNADV